MSGKEPRLAAKAGSEAAAQLEGLAIEPLSVRVAMAVKLTGISRSRIYELIKMGDIEVVKIGRSTFIRFASLKQLIGGRSGA